MKKVYSLEDLDCANCALKMEEAARRLEGVKNVSVNFMTQRLTLEAEDASYEEVLKKVIKTLRKVEPDCRVVL